MQTIDVPLRAIAEAEYEAEEAQRAQHEKQERARIWKERSKRFEALLRGVIELPKDLVLTLDPDEDVDVDGIGFRLMANGLGIVASDGQVHEITSQREMYGVIHALSVKVRTIPATSPSTSKSIG